jgi:hypothetical protein
MLPRAEPVFVNPLRSPGIDSQPGGIDSSEAISGLFTRLQIRAQETETYAGQLRKNPNCIS